MAISKAITEKLINTKYKNVPFPSVTESEKPSVVMTFKTREFIWKRNREKIFVSTTSIS
jgi:hypothetical protein